VALEIGGEMPIISVMDRDADELQAAMYGKQKLASDYHFIAQELADFKEPRWPDKELALLAFGFPSNADAIVVWCNDGYVRYEIGQQGAHDVATYILDNEAPDHGIWVWEGRMSFCHYPDHNGEYDDPRYITIQWRAPTEEEWEAIREQRNPFEPKPKEDLDWSWGNKTSF
jgi:hypothetical protein